MSEAGDALGQARTSAIVAMAFLKSDSVRSVLDDKMFYHLTSQLGDVINGFSIAIEIEDKSTVRVPLIRKH